MFVLNKQGETGK